MLVLFKLIFLIFLIQWIRLDYLNGDNCLELLNYVGEKQNVFIRLQERFWFLKKKSERKTEVTNVHIYNFA